MFLSVQHFVAIFVHYRPSDIGIKVVWDADIVFHATCFPGMFGTLDVSKVTSARILNLSTLY